MDIILALAVFAVGLVIVFQAHRITAKTPKLRMIRAGGIIIGVLQSALYTYVLGVNLNLWAQVDPVFFGRAVVRPLSLGTLALLLVALSLLSTCRSSAHE